MEAVAPETFRAAPLGRYSLGPTWLAWCWDETLCGSMVWDRPSDDEAQSLVRMFDIEPHLAPRFDVVTDASQMSLVAPAAFARVADYLRRRLPVLGPRIRKNALVTPPGLMGAAIAGLYPLLGPTANWRPLATRREAIEWIDSPAARDATSEIESLASRLIGRPLLLHRLHEHLRQDPQGATLSSAARALGMAVRSLQRKLNQHQSSFRDELMAVRIEEARRRLAEGEEKQESLAIELGFSSASHFGAAFLAAVGVTPGEFRARYRAG